MSSLDQSSSSSDSRADWDYGKWQGQWDVMLKHVNNLMGDGKVFMAIQYIASALFLFVGEFTEDYQMGKQAKIQKILTKIQDLRNDIETQFDTTKDGPNATAGQNALNDYYGTGPKQTSGPYKGFHQNMGILDYLNWGVQNGVIPQDIANSIEQQFIPTKDSKAGGTPTGGGIFQGNYGASDGAALAKTWNGFWGEDDPTKPNSIQVVTNGLTAVSTDVSSQSSIVQSKLKFDEANDEQYKSITHSIQSEYINQEKQMNTAMQSAS